MSNSNNNIHHGELLREAADKSDLTITQISKRAGFNRTTFYNHIENPVLPYHVLEKYAKVLAYDFIKFIPEMEKFKQFEEPSTLYKKPETIEEAIDQREHWKNRYYELLERYNDLMEKLLKSNNEKS